MRIRVGFTRKRVTLTCNRVPNVTVCSGFNCYSTSDTIASINSFQIIEPGETCMKRVAAAVLVFALCVPLFAQVNGQPRVAETVGSKSSPPRPAKNAGHPSLDKEGSL